MMKVLHINCNYIGTTLHQTMIEHLNKLEIESKVFVPTYDINISTIKVNDNVAVSKCFNKSDRFIFDYKSHKILRSVQKLFDIKSFDLLHAYTLFTDGNVAMRLKKKYGIPYVVAIRNTDVNVFFKYMIHLRSRGIQIMKNASAIFFLSESYKKQVFEKYVPINLKYDFEKKTHVIPNGIDDFWFENLRENFSVDKFHNYDWNDNLIKVIYAGRIDANKNIETTQKALKILREKGYNTKFTVVGKVIDKFIFQRIISDKYTEYIESQPKEKLIDLYRKNDIFVMTSFTETFGLVYAEAMSQGLPIIYTKGQGFDGQFPDGSIGYAVDSLNTKELAELILRIHQSYLEIQRNVLLSVHRFEWDTICQTYRDIYAKCFMNINSGIEGEVNGINFSQNEV